MAAFKSVEEIDAWKRGCRLAVHIYEITQTSQFDKDWGLRDQLRRSAVSISSNIAEGFERGGTTEFNRFIRIGKGSCGELRTQIYIAQAIGYVEKAIAQQIVTELKEISSMLSGLSKYLKENQH